jgi:ABC-type transport system involved in cytochrome bd biosynthesis fused ATPase/permease subunit
MKIAQSRCSGGKVNENMPKTSRCQTVLIPDQIASADAFRHREVADAIADLISENQGGCGIALTGSWGSGKSTIVNLLEAVS